MTIGCAINLHQEVNALPGFLESATAFFSDILVVDCGPGGKPSDDGTLDILRKWGIPWQTWDINDGFGAIRTRLIQESKTDWVVIMDADERMMVTAPLLECEGDGCYPKDTKPDLRLKLKEPGYNHRAFLSSKIADAESKGLFAVQAIRRNWFTMGLTSPTRNWHTIPDFQLRILKRVPQIGYRPDVAMHEQAWDSEKQQEPEHVLADTLRGPFFEHYKLWWKRMEPEQTASDLATYERLAKGSTTNRDS